MMTKAFLLLHLLCVASLFHHCLLYTLKILLLLPFEAFYSLVGDINTCVCLGRRGAEGAAGDRSDHLISEESSLWSSSSS